jgi:hypothetical protein
VDNLPLDRVDIDHVVITPAAALAVETKYHSRLDRSSAAYRCRRLPGSERRQGAVRPSRGREHDLRRPLMKSENGCIVEVGQDGAHFSNVRRPSSTVSCRAMTSSRKPISRSSASPNGAAHRCAAHSSVARHRQRQVARLEV